MQGTVLRIATWVVLVLIILAFATMLVASFI